MITEFHAKYYAYELNRIGGFGVDRLGRALFDACVDLNPHQIEAALFAMRSPLSKGVLLADEVGLGKTIEAGLTICQHWAERKRHILVICPASLRKQWSMELEEKFNLPAIVMDAKAYREVTKKGNPNPFDQRAIIITSMHYAGLKADNIKEIAWDLVVIDEAHKLRNAYRESNQIGQKIRWATEGQRKILLTAIPLQNSLTELYGLSTLIDERLFGDLPSFRTQYMNTGGDLSELRARLQSFCWRTLRRQVVEYIKFTERKLITRPFTPTEQEHKLYEAISDFLKSDDNYDLPKGQKHLLILLVRKVLASSPQAVAGTLEIIRTRLLKIKSDYHKKLSLVEQIVLDDVLDDDILDELLEDQEDTEMEVDTVIPENISPEKTIDIAKLDKEIAELDDYIRWAHSIGIDTKSRALIKALEIGFAKMAEMNAPQKAVVFTESRRTQSFLKDYLEANGYAGKILLFNGSNNDPESVSIYNRWLTENQALGRVTNSRAIDIRSSIIEEFRNKASIMIATEAAAEGINLQFCSLVINYDLPWNPQRIEQRIGRCHRYGQQHDVVVINFLNERNDADIRVYELLKDKFNLFTGIFGASDEVLGSIESGVDFERRVMDIYQQCRTADAIAKAFAELQAELDEKIQSRLSETRQMLLEHFDEDVHDRLKSNLLGTSDKLDRIGKLFWALTKFELDKKADFDDIKHCFRLVKPPLKEFKKGTYHLISKLKANTQGDFLYRLSHPLGEYVIQQGINHAVTFAELIFDITHHNTRVRVIEQLKGNSGWLKLDRLIINSLDKEEYLLFSALDDNGASLDQETCEKLFLCHGIINPIQMEVKDLSRLEAESNQHISATMSISLEENHKHFTEARDQLDKWAEDMIKSVEKELDDVKRQIKEKQRLSRQAQTLSEQHSVQEDIVKLDKKKRKLREKIFDIEDEIVEKRDKLIDALTKRLKQKTQQETLFTIRWKVV